MTFHPSTGELHEFSSISRRVTWLFIHQQESYMNFHPLTGGLHDFSSINTTITYFFIHQSKSYMTFHPSTGGLHEFSSINWKVLLSLSKPPCNCRLGYGWRSLLTLLVHSFSLSTQPFFFSTGKISAKKKKENPKWSDFISTSGIFFFKRITYIWFFPYVAMNM